MKHYWAVKHEFQAIDSLGSNVQLSTVQLDIKDAGIYGINFVDHDNTQKPCICHSSIGSIERWIYAIYEQALEEEMPCLPLWLAPVQLRVIPEGPGHVFPCRELPLNGIRWDIDDSAESVGKRIAKAGREWIPLVAVVGDKELASGKLQLRIRQGPDQCLPVEDIPRWVQTECNGMPYRSLSIPRLVSRRPSFVG